MQRMMFLSALAAAAAGAGQPVQEPREETQAEARGLTRVLPNPSQETRLAPVRFDAEHWRTLLSQDDLGAREESFGRLVERAEVDEVARDFLDDLSQGSDRELAWTARLALRDVAQRVEQREARPYQDLLLLDSLGGVDEIFGGLLPGFNSAPGMLRIPGATGAQTYEENVSIERTADGWTVRVTTFEDGEKRTNEYRGETLEEILAANPELGNRLLITKEAPGGLSMQFGHRHGGPLVLDRFFSDALKFRGALPVQPFVWSDKEGQRGHMRFRFTPTERSQPIATDRLGVRVQELPDDPRNDRRREELGVEPEVGLYVELTVPRTIAHLMGVGPGDVLIRLNERSLKTAQDITDALEQWDPGEAIRLEWFDSLGELRKRTWDPRQGIVEDER